jgi:hypothetical protein
MSEKKVSELLSRAGAAHHTYEQTVLQGAYDPEWPTWYAEYAIEHGLNELLPRAMSVPELSQFLIASNQGYEQGDKRQAWADFTAAGLAGREGADDA